MSSRTEGLSRRGGALGWTVLALCLVSLALAAALAERARRLSREAQSRLAVLEIVTDPPAAEVRLDGQFAGLSPVIREKVEAGEHLIEVRHGGYLPQAERHPIGAGRARVDIRLRKQPTGSLDIRSIPEGAEVLLDGQSRGNTPLEIGELSPGTYRLVLHKAGRDYWSQPVGVQAEKTTKVSAELQDHVLTFLLAAVEADPKKISNWTELGHFYGVRGREDESAEAFKKGLALCMIAGANGDEINRHFQMLNRQMHWPGRDRTEFRKKITDGFLEIARENADNPAGITKLASILAGQRRFPEAMDLYVAACQKTGGTNAELVGNGFALGVKLVQIDKARELADLGRKGRPQDGSLRMVLGSHCLGGYARLEGKARTDTLALAEELYAEAAGLLPDHAAKAKALYDQARAQGFQDKSAEASATYARAAEELAAAKGDRNKWAEWLFESASLQIKLGKTDDARATLGRIVKDGPEGKVRSRAQQELARLAPPPPPPPPPPQIGRAHV